MLIISGYTHSSSEGTPRRRQQTRNTQGEGKERCTLESARFCSLLTIPRVFDVEALSTRCRMSKHNTNTNYIVGNQPIRGKYVSRFLVCLPGVSTGAPWVLHQEDRRVSCKLLASVRAALLRTICNAKNRDGNKSHLFCLLR